MGFAATAHLTGRPIIGFHNRLLSIRVAAHVSNYWVGLRGPIICALFMNKWTSPTSPHALWRKHVHHSVSCTTFCVWQPKMFKVKQFGKNFHKAQQNSSRQPGRSVSLGTSHICKIQSLKRCRQISSVNIYYSLALEKSFCSGLRNFFIFVFIGCSWSVQSFMREYPCIFSVAYHLCE